jgi:phosphatidylethanolamine N-methyltransferase
LALLPNGPGLSYADARWSCSYNHALSKQPVNALLLHPAFTVLGGALFAAGNIFVLSSMWALGVTGTYLGDYFGILMDEMVTGFPFNVMSDPMYWGSSMCFVGVSLW